MMSDNSAFDVSQLPEMVKVKVMRGKTGVFIAELPEYNALTEADTLGELDFYVNDLIYTLFGVPKEWHGKVRYMPVPKPASKQLPQLSISGYKPIRLNKFSTTEFYQHYLLCQ